MTRGALCSEPRQPRALLKRGYRKVAFLWAALGVAGQLSAAPAQLASSNHVLELDGAEAYVELPPNSLDDLTEAMVEAWVRWDEFGERLRRAFN
jgi:hypothetical protein